MKAFCLLGLFVLLNATLFAQASKNLSLKAWIKQKGYIVLSDKSKLPKSILPYYEVIKDSVIKKHSRFNNFPDFATSYLPAHGVGENDTTFGVTIYPLAGLKMIKYYDDKRAPAVYNKETKEYTQLIDDFGGSVGEVIVKLDKATGKINFYNTQ